MYLRGAQTAVDISSGKLNFLMWRLTFVLILLYGTLLTPRIMMSLLDVWKIRGPLLYIKGVYRDCSYRVENVLFRFVA
jgi:hypothetical protein